MISTIRNRRKGFSSVSAFRPDIPSLRVLARIRLREPCARFFLFSRVLGVLRKIFLLFCIFA